MQQELIDQDYHLPRGSRLARAGLGSHWENPAMARAWTEDRLVISVPPQSRITGDDV